MKLPEAILNLADRSSNEEAWRIEDVPRVLDLASEYGLACIGGQFQFRGLIGTAEMYWLNADSLPQLPEEDWEPYVERANSEVRESFDRICRETDFDAEAMTWEHIRESLASGVLSDPKEHLYFVAYFSQDPTKAEQAAS